MLFLKYGSSLFVILLTFINCELTVADYEFWLNGRNITSNISEALTDQNENITCEADFIRIKKKMEELKHANLPCAENLKSLSAENIGLSRINNASFQLLPSIVQNLTIAGNSIKKIEAGVFSNIYIEYLNLSSNKIEHVASDAFNNMKNLKSLVLDHNEITVYNISFLDCPKLRYISLKYNFIIQLSEGILKNLKTNILTVVLSYNRISDVHKAALDVKQFQEVYLDHNELKNANLLIKLVKAEKVDLSENHITCLPKEFMENGLSKIKLLNLTGNPLECNCLHDLQRKMRKNIEFQKMSPLVQNIKIVLPDNKTTTC